MVLDAGEINQVNGLIDSWWGASYKIVKSRRGTFDDMPTLLDGEVYYSRDTDEHFGGDDVDGPHLISGVMQGAIVNRPAAGVPDRIYYATDEEISYIDDGSVWRTFGLASRRKTVDESISSSTVLQDDDNLYFMLNASEKCIFEFVIFFTTADANPDIKVAITATAGLTDLRYSIQFMAVAAASMVDGSIQTVSGNSDDYDYDSACNSVVYLRGSLENAVAINTINFQWAQRSSNAAATIVKAGSYVVWKLVG